MPICSRRVRRKSNGRRSFLSVFIVLFVSVSNLAEACPGFLLTHQLPLKNRDKIDRSSLQLFTWNPEAAERWQTQPIQIDPLDDEGNLVFLEDKDWRKKPLGPFDRLSFSVAEFSKRFDGKAPFPCQPTTDIVELDSANGYAYLASCPDTYQKIAFPEPVELDEKLRLVTARAYKYHYSKRNHLVFDRIDLADPSFKKYNSVAMNSDLLIVGDVRNFFTLYFDSSDIDAFIIHKQNGSMGLMGGLQFYLKILYFKIQMSLMPEVNFFADSLFMPMTLTLPVDAKKYLRRGSGIYYTWLGDPNTEWLWEQSELENLDPAILDPNFKGTSPMPSEKYCNRVKCRYKLLGRNQGRLFSLHFAISRKAAELGFFPRLIRDVPAIEKLIKHPLSQYSAKDRIGIYFETARMPEGEHTWDFWIHFPENEQGTCNINVRARPFLAVLPSLDKK